MTSPHNSNAFERWLRRGKHEAPVKELGMFFLSELDFRDTSDLALTGDNANPLDLFIVSVQSNGLVGVWGRLRRHWTGPDPERMLEVTTQPFQPNGKHVGFSAPTTLRSCATQEVVEFLADNEAHIAWADLLPQHAVFGKHHMPLGGTEEDSLRFAIVTGAVIIPANTTLKLSTKEHTSQFSSTAESWVCGYALELRQSK